MHEEEWRDPPGLERYEVSNTGGVRNKVTGRELAQRTSALGYKLVHLRGCQSTKTMRVHRLVAAAFLPNWDPALTVDHIDRVRSNNHVSNLRMATRQDQARNQDRSAMRGEAQAVHQLLDGIVVATFVSMKEAAKAVGVSAPTMSNCIAGRVQTAGRFQWTCARDHDDLPGEMWRQYKDTTLIVSNMGRFRRRRQTGLSNAKTGDDVKTDEYPQLKAGGAFRVSPPRRRRAVPSAAGVARDGRQSP